MNWFDPYTFLLTFIGISGIYLSIALLKPPRKLSRTLLSITAGLSGMFIILTVLELVIDSPTLMIELRNVQQIALVLTPVFLLGYAKELHQEAPKQTLKLIGVLLIPSFIDIVLILTDSYHGLMRKGVTIEKVWNYTEVSVDSTFLNAFFGTYPFVLSIITISMLVRNMFDVPKNYRRTHWLSAAIIAIPIISIITIPTLGIEIPGTYALSYSSMALFLILVNKRMDFNAVWPVSRQEVIENLSECIFLIDQQEKVIEINHAGYDMMKRLYGAGDCEKEILHHSASTVFEGATPLLEALNKDANTTFEFSKDDQYYDVTVTKLGKKSNYIRLVVWKDITYKKEIEHQLTKMAEMDALTKLTNRRAFIEQYHNVNNHSACFILLDIDHFKRFNDRYGHIVGDKVLIYLSQLMKLHFPVATLTRLGGEEFGILSYEKTVDAVCQIEKFQRELKEDSSIIDSLIEEEVSVSVGIYEVQPGDSFEKAYQLADEAMYEAKQEGRDRICIKQSSGQRS
ncbi:histidine kinase N-terminal 7TM domain-containing diguanylate cyclase [Halobacillus salinus]|nr:GGDEF domain-containing protein [Halobacillus salinus]